jgi:hypothetical protein
MFYIKQTVITPGVISVPTEAPLFPSLTKTEASNMPNNSCGQFPD